MRFHRKTGFVINALALKYIPNILVKRRISLQLLGKVLWSLVLEEEGVCLAKSVVDKYKELILTEHDNHDIPYTEYLNYKRLVKINIEAKGYMCYCPCPA